MPYFFLLNVFSGGTYGQLRVFYNTMVVTVSEEAYHEGSTVLSFFSFPNPGQHPQTGTSVDVSQAEDPLMVRSKNN